jgi:lysophospholipase L1-like esterase
VRCCHPHLAGFAVAAALSTSACSSPTAPPTTIIIPPPAITCPATPAPVTTTGQSALVTYGAAIVTGGTAPVSTSCVPSSGSTFNIGSTPVACIAADAVRRTASCSFAATVTLPPPRLSVTTILAFGDSLTAGEVPVLGEFSFRPRYYEPASSYPADLVTLLAQRYTGQGASGFNVFTVDPTNRTICVPDPPRPPASGILVINAGCGGERAQDALGRLNGALATYHPDLVLLLDGTNDLNDADPTSVTAGAQGVQALVAAAQGSGAHVMVGTLPPQIASDFTHGGSADLVVPFNTQLVATIAGAQIVQIYNDLATDQTDWISPYDGFHLTEAGYQEMARVWFASIQNAFELPPSSPATPTSRPTHTSTRRSESRR